MSAEIDPKYLTAPKDGMAWPPLLKHVDTDGDSYGLAVGAAPEYFAKDEPVVRIRVGYMDYPVTIHMSLADSQALRESLYQAERQAAAQFDEDLNDDDDGVE